MSSSSPYYGYTPSAPANIVGAVLFGAQMILSIRYGTIHKHKWFNNFWRLGLILEFMGYVARAVSHWNLTDSTAYELQYIVLFIGPSFMLRAIYYQLGKLMTLYDYESGMVRSKTASIALIVLDILSLVLQLVGAILTVTYYSSTNGNINSLNAARGLAIAGLSLQFLLTLVFFAGLAWFWTTVMPNRSVLPEYSNILQRKLFPYFAPGLLAASLFFMVRIVFRIVYDADTGATSLRTKEFYVLVLDGLMVLIASLITSAVQPTFSLGAAKLPVLKQSKGRSEYLPDDMA